MKAVRLICLTLTALAMFGGAAAAQTTPAPADNPASNADEVYRIGYQDVIEVRVFRQPDLTLRYNINPDGTIDLMRSTKQIQAVCKTERELAQEIAKEYLTFLRRPQVNVFAVEKKSQSYGVIGAVEKAGNYFVNRRIRLLELLTYAGGPNKEAGSRLLVARTGSSSACRDANDAVPTDELVLMNFKINDVLKGAQSLWMQPGDIISVLDADQVYVYGNVNKVGSVTMREPITLTQAIVSAEGLRPTAKSVVRILRQVDGGSERKEFTYNLKDIEKRKVEDPFLEPNDIVAVSEDSTKAVLRGIGDVFKNGVPSLFYRIP